MAYEQTDTQVKCPHCNWWTDKNDPEFGHVNPYVICERCNFKIYDNELMPILNNKPKFSIGEIVTTSSGKKTKIIKIVTTIKNKVIDVPFNKADGFAYFTNLQDNAISEDGLSK